MEFTKRVVPAGTAIKAEGPIRAGDAAKLQSLVREATVDEKGLRRIILESPGGEVPDSQLGILSAEIEIMLVGVVCL